jgi:F-box-like
MHTARVHFLVRAGTGLVQTCKRRNSVGLSRAQVCHVKRRLNMNADEEALAPASTGPDTVCDPRAPPQDAGGGTCLALVVVHGPSCAPPRPPPPPPRPPRACMSALPSELLVHVVSWLDGCTLAGIARVCCRWRDLAGSERLWCVAHPEPFECARAFVIPCAVFF